jgi:hypothetical protein
MEKKILTPEERIKVSENLATSYRDVYTKKTVKTGKTFEWVFADNATYWSPYFGNTLIDLSKAPVSVEDSSSFEALSYSIEFPDWGMLDFEYWPAVNGCAWKSHMGGHRKSDGKFMDFYAYSFLKTNEYGEITHWETHTNDAYDTFLDVAIDSHGPYLNDKDYMNAVMKKLKAAGVDLSKIKH